MAERQAEKDHLMEKMKRLLGWKRFLGVLFRILILSGLIFLVVLTAGLIFASWFRWWTVLLAAGLIVLGVVLARCEYQLHQRLYSLEKESQNTYD